MNMNQNRLANFSPYLLLSPYPLAFGFLLCALAFLAPLRSNSSLATPVRPDA